MSESARIKKLLEVLMLTSALTAGQASAALAGTLLVGNKAEATVSLLDADTGKVIKTLPVGLGPHEIAVTPDGKTAVVANYGNQATLGSSLTLIDVPSATVTKTIDISPYRRPHGMVALAGGRLFVTCEANKALVEVDLNAGKVVRAIQTGQEVSHMVALAPDAGRAYIANIGSGSMTVLDLKEGKHVKDVKTGAGAEGIEVTPDGKQVWVTNRGADTVSLVDAATLEVVQSFPSPKVPIRAKATPDGRQVVVSNANSSDLSVFSAAEKKLLRRIAVPLPADIPAPPEVKDPGSLPVGILFEPSGKRLFVAHSYGDFLSVVDLEAGKVVKTFKAGKGPDGMGYSPLAVGGK